MADTQYTMADLQYLMARLRDPATGCPWDIEQTFASIVPSTIEEAYEVADAIGRSAFDELLDELGDLLFQVIFYAQMASEQQRFDLGDIIHGIVTKLIRRHPHVFVEGTLSSVRKEEAPDEQLIKESWEKIKQEERLKKGDQGVLSSVPAGLPGLIRAQKLGKRASTVGFDWPDVQGVVDKVDEELLELKNAITSADKEHIGEELGDLLFTLAQLSRHLGVNVEQCIQGANHKFASRFEVMERIASQPLGNITAEGLEQLWDQVKRQG